MLAKLLSIVDACEYFDTFHQSILQFFSGYPNAIYLF